MNNNVMGRLMEWGAKLWLTDKYPKYHWSQIVNGTNPDLKGIDIVGSLNGDNRKRILIQVKSSIEKAAEFSERYLEYERRYHHQDLEIVVIIPDEETGGFKEYFGKLPR